MRKLSLPILLIAATSLFAQLPSNTVAIRASRSIALQPDQVVFGLAVTSGNTTTLDQIVAALSGLGITAADFTGTDNSNAPAQQWNFTLTAPFSNLTPTIGSLTKLQQTITQNNSGLTLTFSVNGTQVSQKLQQSQTCSNADLISDATAQAQTLVSAAGKTLGPIVRLSNAPLQEPTLVEYTGAVYLGLSVVPIPLFANFLLGSPSPVTCSLLVYFQLLP